MRTVWSFGVVALVLCLVGTGAANGQIAPVVFVPNAGAGARALAADHAGFFGGVIPTRREVVVDRVSYYPGPLGAYLDGVARVTIANAEYQRVIQDARLARVRAQLAMLEYRRERLEQMEREYSNRPSAERWRLERLRREEREALGYPSLSLVWTGRSLNALLRAARRAHAAGVVGPAIELDAEVRKHLRLSDGTTRGGTGILASARTPWPVPLVVARFDEDRKAVDSMLPEAIRQASYSGIVDPNLLRKLNTSVKNIQRRLDEATKSMSPDDCNEAQRVIDELARTVRSLRYPTTRRYINGNWSARGVKTVRELVDHMSREGLQFAPACAGDRSSYTVTHHMLARYVLGLRGQGPKPREKP